MIMTFVLIFFQQIVLFLTEVNQFNFKFKDIRALFIIYQNQTYSTLITFKTSKKQN